MIKVIANSGKPVRRPRGIDYVWPAAGFLIFSETNHFSLANQSLCHGPSGTCNAGRH